MSIRCTAPKIFAWQSGWIFVYLSIIKQFFNVGLQILQGRKALFGQFNINSFKIQAKHSKHKVALY